MTKPPSLSKTNRFDVFDFNQEDEGPEISSRNIMKKFENPRLHDTLPFNKLKLLRSVANGPKKQVSAAPSLDPDSVDGGLRRNGNAASGADLIGDFPHSNSCKDEQNTHCQTDNHTTPIRIDSSSKPLVSGSQQLNRAILDYPSTTEPVETDFTDPDEGNSESSSSTPASDVAKDSVSFDGEVLDDHFRDWEMNGRDMAVFLSPDYMIFRDKYCTFPLLAFSSSSVRVKWSTETGSQGICAYKWDIGDVIFVECQWRRRFDSVAIKLHVSSRDVLEAGNVDEASGTEELKFEVVDRNWSGKQEQIMSLSLKYKAVWKTVLEEEDNMLAHESDLIEKRYFPIFDETFEDVVYPKGDADAVSLTKRDVDLLQPETFINDTIIDFYIKYLKNKLLPEESHRFHFFNSFFFRKLADMDKDPSKASDGRAAFLRVRKWTRKVNLFEKDYIFLPINFNLHWSLIVICHAGEVIKFEDEDIEKSCRVPCILHMDSIKGCHSGLKEIIQSYLWEEWKEKQKEKCEDLSSKFYNMRFVSLEVPQQENFYDCGIFLLHYVERFLEEAPLNFNPLTISKFSNFLSSQWFLPSETSLIRASIQRLIYYLEVNSGDTSSAGCNNEQRLKFSENNENETCVELIEETGCPSKACDGNLSSRDSGRGIEMTLLASSSLNSQCVNESGLVLREFITPGAATGSYGEQYQSFDPTASFHNGAMVSIVEEEERKQHFLKLPPGETGFQQLTGVTPDAYPCIDFSGGASWSTGISMELPGHEPKDVDSSPETSSCASDDTLQIGFHTITPVREDADANQHRTASQSGSLSTENIACLTDNLTCGSSGLEEIAEDPQSPDKLLPCNKKEEPCLGSQEKPNALLTQDSCVEETKGVMQFISDELNLDSEPRAKRLRVTPPIDGECGLTETLSEDLHL